MTRQFEYEDARLEEVPLLVGLVGPSFSGKTFSALRLGTGMQLVVGGDLAVVDTEQGRATHYHDKFKFKHVPLTSPFDPDSYLAAIEHCVSKGARTVVIDSGSHCWEGTGGVLEWHERELDRMAGNDWKKRDRVTFAAWVKPKQAYQRLVNTMLQLPINMIWCFRAKERIQIPKKGDADREPKDMGFMSIAGKEMKYEFPLQCLLYPGSNGVPTWESEKAGEREMMKLPLQFQKLFADSKPLDESIGEALATWAKGGAAPKASAPAADAPEAEEYERVMDSIAAADTVSELTGIANQHGKRGWSAEQRGAIRAAINQRKAELSKAADGEF